MTPAPSTTPDTVTQKPRILYVVSEDWYFLSHRLPMARAARDGGFEVHVATRVVDGGAAIEAEGFTLHPIPFARGRLAPLAAAETIRALRRLHWQIAPDVAHHVAVQVSVLGSIAAIGQPVAVVNALTGLGYVFTSGGRMARTLRPIITRLLRLLFNRPGRVALVQNPDDREALEALGIAPERIVLIPGSGVDVERFHPLPEPEGPVTIGFVGRLLDDKGIRTLVQAFRLLRNDGLQVELLIAGTPDPANPASVTKAEAASWNREAGMKWLGHVSDPASLWRRAHIAVLPSRREGLPMSLLEAAACARPMVASDVPGCREIVIDSETGLLVPPDDPLALALSIRTLVLAPELRAQLGRAARQRVVERFSSNIIGESTVALYRRFVTPA